MENLALVSSKFPVPVGSFNPSEITNRWRPPCPSLPLPAARGRGASGGARRPRFVSSALQRGIDGASQRIPKAVVEKMDIQGFASISSSSSSQMTTSSGVPRLPVPPPSMSNIGSPLFWIGVGVGLSALFSMVATRLKRYAMQQAFNTMMNQAAQQTGQFNNSAFSPGSPFPFPAAPASAPNTSSPSPAMTTHVASQPVVTVDVPATKVEATPSTEVGNETETKKEPKKYAFVDVSPEESLQKESTEASAESIYSEKEVSLNGAAINQDKSASSEQSQSRKSAAGISVEALEKMMEDPTVQKMVYPYLPEEMRNPTTFKMMLQNPQYRQQLQDMLNNMGGSSEWDNRMMESLRNFNLSSPDVKKQFDQIGLTPEEVISKIMANPEVAMAFQNPRVQAAIMDCSQNPLSIAKYQNDKEVMDVFMKISELFPGVTGYP
ncbi:protein TIC 40, chloroplastic [Cocos nucifera]|uniref:Protein TIC 40, chloroplastic n=1 Tax=Cocos nucifera TaxID=13894 RepID=A0A8K0NDE0_COCNU|nr:protein TIC 40, chloroplastic [Cocos nucifera]